MYCKECFSYGKDQSTPEAPILLISCFLVNSISLILKISRSLYFKDIDAAVGKVSATISSSLCQGRIWHQKPRGFLKCFASGLKTESLYCVHRRRITKWETSPSLICLMSWKVKANENFLFYFFLNAVHAACLVHVLYILPGSNEE